MSGFDGMARSQAQASQASQFYDAQRYESMRQTGQSVMQLGQFGVEVQQLATEQAMRVQEHEINMQQSMAKLQSMNMMNESDMLRQQVVAMRLQNEAMAFENKNRADTYKSQQAKDSAATYRSIVGSMSGDEWAAFGVNPTKFDAKTFSFAEMTPEEQKEYGERRQAQRYRSGSNVDIDVKRAQNEYKANQDALDDAIANGASPEQIEQLTSVTQGSFDRYVDMARQRGGIPSGGGGTRQLQPPKLTDDQRTLSKSIRERLRSSMDAERTRLLQESSAHNFSGQIPTLLEGAEQKVADYLASKSEEYRIRQQRGYDADPKRKGLVATGESAVEEILKILSNMKDPRRPAVLAELKNRGVL